jgi:MFS family permease
MQAADVVGFAARRNIYYGWVVAGVTFLAMLVTAGAVGAPGVLIVPLQKEFGWTAEQISGALAIRLLLFGLIGPFAAAFLNYFGMRKVIVIALALIFTGIAISLAMTEVWQLFILWGVVVGFGTGLTAMVLGATVATRWFTDRRGLVMGLMSASVATGQLVFLPLLAQLTDLYGWRYALIYILRCIAAIWSFRSEMSSARAGFSALSAFFSGSACLEAGTAPATLPARRRGLLLLQRLQILPALPLPGFGRRGAVAPGGKGVNMRMAFWNSSTLRRACSSSPFSDVGTFITSIGA